MTQDPTVPRSPADSEALSRLAEVHDLINGLEMRLFPVLVDVPVADSKTSSNGSDLVRDIDNVRERLETLLGRINV